MYISAQIGWIYIYTYIHIYIYTYIHIYIYTYIHIYIYTYIHIYPAYLCTYILYMDCTLLCSVSQDRHPAVVLLSHTWRLERHQDVIDVIGDNTGEMHTEASMAEAKASLEGPTICEAGAVRVPFSCDLHHKAASQQMLVMLMSLI